MIEEHNTIRIYIDGRGNKYKYCNPVFCNYPKKRKIVIKKILFENPNDRDTYTLAKLDYTDVDGTNECLAFRWNITSGEKVKKKNTEELCLGYPYNARGEPEWVILPNIMKYFEIMFLQK